MKKIPVTLICFYITALVVIALWASGSYAYDRYNSGCQSCHGAFTNKDSTKPNNTWSSSKHDVHRDQMLNGVCDACHLQGDNDDPYLNKSNGTVNLPGIGCLGCHGSDNNGTSSGAGLRAHHSAKGVTSCTPCHSADPAPPSENILPVFYGKPTVNISNSCNSDGSENWTSDGLGLDNDGDLLYDSSDPDCASPIANITVSPLAVDFGTVTAGMTKTLTVTIGNTGSTGLTVTGLTITGSSDFTLNAGTPAPPFTVAAAASTSVLVNYTPSGSGADSGSLAIASNDPDEALVSVDLMGSGITSSTSGVDLDISEFKVKESTCLQKAKPVKIKLKVKNNGTIDEPRNATVIGVQNGIEVYHQTMLVSAKVDKDDDEDDDGDDNNDNDGDDHDGKDDDKESHSHDKHMMSSSDDDDDDDDDGPMYEFPSYIPTAAGVITWTATIADDDPDMDMAKATTDVYVKQKKSA